MSVFAFIGAVVCGWAMLCVMGAERQRGLNELRKTAADRAASASAPATPVDSTAPAGRARGK